MNQSIASAVFDSRAEAERAVSDIEEFSQLGGFLNLPVRT